MQALFGGNINLPSPPTSPRMSGFSPNQSGAGWQSHHLKPNHVSFTPSGDATPTTNVEPVNATSLTDAQPPPLLRSYRSSPFLFDSAMQSANRLQEQNGEPGPPGASNSNPEVAETLNNNNHQNNISNITGTSSAPASPVSGRSHVSPKAENFEDQANEFQELDFDVEDDEDMEQSGIKPEMTAAEIRAQKRKMKRFRYAIQPMTRILILITRLPERLTFSQTYTQSNTFSDERIRTTSSSRRSASRTAVKGDSGAKPAPGTSLVSESVSNCHLTRNTDTREVLLR